MAKPPRSMALNPASAPESLPMGVRAPARMTEPGMDITSDGPCQPDGAGWWAEPILRDDPGLPPRRTGSGAAWEAAGTGRVGCVPMQAIREAILAGATGDELGAMALPESYRAAHVRRDEVDMFAGVDSADKDPRKSLHVSEVPVPELAPDEAYLAVMASSINFNTVWTSIFEPLPTFGFLDRLGKESVWGARHALDYHVVGSDASGVVLRVGSAVRNWTPGRQGHRALQLRRRPGPLGPRRLHAGRQPAHLGLRDQLRRPGRSGRGQGQPAHAQGRAT